MECACQAISHAYYYPNQNAFINVAVVSLY